MSIMFENLKISRLIVHEIYKKEIEGNKPPYFSNELMQLDLKGKLEFESRVINAIGHHSHSIEMDIIQVDKQSVYAYASPILNSDVSNELFIETTKKITDKLVLSQSKRTIPGGAVIVFDGTICSENKRCLGIIKAEKHGGFHLKDDTNKMAFNYINDLILTPQQKLYKIALLINNNENDTINFSPSLIGVFIFDNNNVKTASKTSADYFWNSFMGCAYQKNSQVATKDFFHKTKEFITKKSTLSGEKIVDTMSALYTYLKVDTTQTISVSDFAERYFTDASIKDSYEGYMQSQKIPMNSIHKDISMLSLKKKERKIKFNNLVKIYAPVEKFNDNVKIIETTNEETIIQIKGRVASED